MEGKQQDLPLSIHRTPCNLSQNTKQFVNGQEKREGKVNDRILGERLLFWELNSI